ncbi:MAG: hypothetical protein IJ400_06250 [Clostridia bacterium]|nr:hypothetical protein [Clostridia bacterium]
MHSFIYTLANMVTIPEPELNALNMLEWCTIAEQVQKCPHCEEELENELDLLKKSKTSLCFHLMLEIQEYSEELGYPMYVSGEVGRSYISYLMRLSPFNPAKHFAYCEECEDLVENAEWDRDYNCMQCGKLMVADGFGLPSFEDFCEEKSPAFEITVAKEVKEKIIDFLNEHFYYFEIDEKTTKELLDLLPTDARLSKIGKKAEEMSVFQLGVDKNGLDYGALINMYVDKMVKER